MSTLKAILHLATYCEDDTGLYKAISAAFVSKGHTLKMAYLKSPREKNNDFYTTNPADHFFNFSSADVKGLRFNVIKKLIDFIKIGKFDTVLVHRMKPGILLAVVSMFLPIKNKILVIHGESFKRLYQRVLARLLMRSFTIVGVSEAVRRNLLTLKIFKPEQLVVIYNGIDVKRVEATQFSRQEARNTLGIPSHSFVFGHVARQVKCKGQKYLLTAFSNAKIPNAYLVLIGEGPETDNLKLQARDLNIHDRVIFSGKIPHAARYMKAFDVFVLPSLEESFGVVLLEAMAAKLPLIATNAGGISEVIHGLITPCPLQNSTALRTEMQKYYEMSETELKDLGHRAYQHLLQHFSIERLQNAYQGLLSPQA